MLRPSGLRMRVSEKQGPAPLYGLGRHSLDLIRTASVQGEAVLGSRQVRQPQLDVMHAGQLSGGHPRRHGRGENAGIGGRADAHGRPTVVGDDDLLTAARALVPMTKPSPVIAG